MHNCPSTPLYKKHGIVEYFLTYFRISPRPYLGVIGQSPKKYILRALLSKGLDLTRLIIITIMRLQKHPLSVYIVLKDIEIPCNSWLNRIEIIYTIHNRDDIRK